MKTILLGLIVICGTMFCVLSCSKEEKEEKVTCTCTEYWHSTTYTFIVNPIDEGFNTCSQFETYMIAQNEDEGFDYDCETN